MTKLEKDYEEVYGQVPKCACERLKFLLDQIDLKRQKKDLFEEIKHINDIEWEEINYTIYVLPKATPRPRKGKNGIFYVSGAKDNKKVFEKYLIKQDNTLITTPVKFECNCYLPIPKSMNKIEQICAELGYIRPTNKPDFDNLAKTYSDILTGFLIYDDALIISGTSEKYYSVKPRIEIKLSYMKDYDSSFNKNKIKRKE